MAIHAKKISAAEREWLQRYEATTGFEPMFQDEIDDGSLSFFEAAKQNIQWFEDHCDDAQRVITRNIPGAPNNPS